MGSIKLELVVLSVFLRLLQSGLFSRPFGVEGLILDKVAFSARTVLVGLGKTKTTRTRRYFVNPWHVGSFKPL